MSVELLYTSAPNGLKQGSRGFCTVLSTQGMPVNLASRLELLSGYRHIFPPQDAQANLNPVAWSHVSLTIGGQVTSILSRIAAYGVDYSGRTNKLAHHVVVGPNERIAAGPARLLQSPGLMRSQWDGACATPPTGPLITQANQAARVCQTWQSLTGDAGWGGVVAEALVAPAGKPLWVIYRLEQQQSLLEMMNEAISLLPEAQRWQATFSTYYTNLPPEVDCKVRFVVEGTEESTKLASRGSSILLTPGVPLTSTSAYVESARTGASITVPASAAPVTRPAAMIDIESMWDEPSNTPLHRTSKVLPPSATLATSLPESPPAIAMPPKLKGALPPAISSHQRKGSKAKLAAMVGVPLILVLLSGGGYAWYQSKQQPLAKLNTEAATQSAATKAKDEKNEKVDTTAVAGNPVQGVASKGDTNEKPAKTQTLTEPLPPTDGPSVPSPGMAPKIVPSGTTTPKSPPRTATQPVVSAAPAPSEPSGGMPSPQVVPAGPTKISSSEDLSSPVQQKSGEIESTPTEVAALDLNASLDADKIFAFFRVKREELKGLTTLTYNAGSAVDKGAASIGSPVSLIKFDSAPLGLSNDRFEKMAKKPSIRLTVGKKSELNLVFDDDKREMTGWLVIHEVSVSANKELELFLKALGNLKIEKNALVEKLKNQGDIFVDGLNVNMGVRAAEYVKTEPQLLAAISAHSARINARLAELKTELEKPDLDKEKRSKLDAEKTKLDRSRSFFGEVEKQMKSISELLQVLKKGAGLTIGKLTLYPNPSDSQTSGLRTKPAPMDVIDLTIKLQLVEQP